jgi:hypothetical protein
MVLTSLLALTLYWEEPPPEAPYFQYYRVYWGTEPYMNRTPFYTEVEDVYHPPPLEIEGLSLTTRYYFSVRTCNYDDIPLPGGCKPCWYLCGDFSEEQMIVPGCYTIGD